MTDILLWLALMFLFPFLGIVAGAHYERWLRNKRRRIPPIFNRRSSQ
jgi:hypothetical protein